LDIDSFGAKPLRTIIVNRNGAITYRAADPPVPFDVLAQQSRLALLGWIRSGDRTAEPGYRRGRVLKTIYSGIRADLTAVSGVLGELSKRYSVPITVVLIPNREQLLKTADYRLQDEVAEIARNSGLDVLTRDWRLRALAISGRSFSRTGTSIPVATNFCCVPSLAI